jgi:hypothetical protein
VTGQIVQRQSVKKNHSENELKKQLTY